MILFVSIIIVFCFLLFNKKNKKAKKKQWVYKPYSQVVGEKGEEVVASLLSYLPEEYFVFNDVYLYIKGRSVQIDHVVISRYGVFVIETKNYTGWIYGNEKSEYWTQTIYENKYQFRNPLKQNYSHIKSLQSIFGIEERVYYPIVVFHDRATLKCENVRNVMYFSELEDYILSQKIPKLHDEIVNRLSVVLNSYSIKDESQKQKHIYNVKQELANKQDLIAKGMCPRCRGRLVERKGKYGNFISCSNYPYCKFSTKIRD